MLPAKDLAILKIKDQVAYAQDEIDARMRDIRSIEASRLALVEIAQAASMAGVDPAYIGAGAADLQTLTDELVDLKAELTQLKVKIDVLKLALEALGANSPPPATADPWLGD